MRIFVAIVLSEEIKAEALAWHRAYPDLPVRWMASENLHITLVPPWVEGDIDEVKAALKSVAAAGGQFRIVFHRIVYGPNQREPRLIWAEGPAVPKMIDLQERLVKMLGVPPPRRDLRLHLTLARFNPKHFSTFAVKHIEEKIYWAQNVDSIVLYQSQTLTDGAKYTVLETFSL